MSEAASLWGQSAARVFGLREGPGTPRAGAVAGFIGGVLMLGCACARAAATEYDVGHPLRLAAASLLGLAHDVPYGVVIAIGLLSHLVVFTAIGCVFGWLVGCRCKLEAAMVLGVALGSLIWALRVWQVMDILNPALRDWAAENPVMWMTDHLVYGAVLGLSPRFACRRGPD